MAKLTLLFSILIFVLSSSVQAGGLDASFWSYRYLARASNFLLVASDALLNGKPALCQIQTQESSLLSQNLKMLVDEKMKTLQGERKNKVLSDAEKCESECTCDLYSLFLETQKDDASKKALAAIESRAKSMTSRQREICAENFKQFCSSRLLKSLR